MKFTKSRVISLWCVSYGLLLALFITNILIVLATNRTILRETNENYCQNLFGSISANAESMISDSKSIYSVVLNNSDPKHILSIANRNDYFTDSAVSNLLNQLSPYANDLSTFFIYIAETDTILSPSGIYPTAVYYTAFFSQYGISYDEWMKSISVDSYRIFTPFREKNFDDILILEKYTDSSGRGMTLAMAFSYDLLLRTSEMPDWIYSCDIYFSDLQGNIFFAQKNSRFEEEVSSIHDLPKVYGSNWSTFNRSTFSSFPFTVTIMYPQSAPWFQMTRLNHIQILLFAVTIILSAITIFFTIRKNYSSVSDILRVLNISNSHSEYEDIQKNIKQLLTENNLYSRQIDSFAEEKSQNILRKCLSQNYSASYIKKLMEDSNLRFPYHDFAVCAFEVFDVSELFGITTDLPYEQKFNDLAFILSNIFSELFSNNSCHCKIVTVDNRIFAIINTDDEARAAIHDVLSYGLDFISKNFFINISYAISELYPMIEDLPKAYAQANYLLQYKEAMGIEKIVTVDDIQDAAPEKLYAFFDTDTEQRLINCIIAGDTKNAVFLTRKLFVDIIDLNLPLKTMRCLMIDIACVLYKIPQNTISIDFAQILSASKNSIKLQDFLVKNVSDLCALFETQKMPKLADPSDIIDYINQNFRQDINLNLLSNHFGISTGYLSSHFKKATGMSVLDYINKTRLSYAKDLLKNTEETVENIGIRAGFSSLRTFNRIFQKYVGTTPSNYRNSSL